MTQSEHPLPPLYSELFTDVPEVAWGRSVLFCEVVGNRLIKQRLALS